MREQAFRAAPDKIVWRGKEYELPSAEYLNGIFYLGIWKNPDGEEVPRNHPDSWQCLLDALFEK